MDKIPNIVKRAIVDTVTDIGQLSPEEIKVLNYYVKKGWLSKGKGGCFPTLKTVYGCPTFDFVASRKNYLEHLFRQCEALGEKIVLKFEKGK